MIRKFIQDLQTLAFDTIYCMYNTTIHNIIYICKFYVGICKRTCSFQCAHRMQEVWTWYALHFTLMFVSKRSIISVSNSFPASSMYPVLLIAYKFGDKYRLQKLEDCSTNRIQFYVSRNKTIKTIPALFCRWRKHCTSICYQVLLVRLSNYIANCFWVSHGFPISCQHMCSWQFQAYSFRNSRNFTQIYTHHAHIKTIQLKYPTFEGIEPPSNPYYSRIMHSSYKLFGNLKRFKWKQKIFWWNPLGCYCVT